MLLLFSASQMVVSTAGLLRAAGTLHGGGEAAAWLWSALRARDHVEEPFVLWTFQPIPWCLFPTSFLFSWSAPSGSEPVLLTRFLLGTLSLLPVLFQQPGHFHLLEVGWTISWWLLTHSWLLEFSPFIPCLAHRFELGNWRVYGQ